MYHSQIIFLLRLGPYVGLTLCRRDPKSAGNGSDPLSARPSIAVAPGRRSKKRDPLSSDLPSFNVVQAVRFHYTNHYTNKPDIEILRDAAPLSGCLHKLAVVIVM